MGERAIVERLQSAPGNRARRHVCGCSWCQENLRMYERSKEKRRSRREIEGEIASATKESDDGQ